MSDILAVTFPFFALVLCGYVAARSRLLPLDAVPGLNMFVLYFALPCMLYRFGSTTPLMQLFSPVVALLWLGCAGLLAAAAVARVACLAPLVLLPPARANGAGQAAGAPESGALTTAIAGAIVGAALPLLAGAASGPAVLAPLCAFGLALAVVPLAREKIGGQTGDVAGAAEQLAEIAYLAALSTAVVAS